MSTPPDCTSNSAQQEGEERLDLGIYYLDMVECPLNPAHKLRRHRLPYHVAKCKKNFPNKVQCPYDHNYYVDKEKLAIHLQTCFYKKDSQPNVIQQNKNDDITSYNYNVDNYEINEPYWD